MPATTPALPPPPTSDWGSDPGYKDVVASHWAKWEPAAPPADPGYEDVVAAHWAKWDSKPAAETRVDAGATRFDARREAVPEPTYGPIGGRGGWGSAGDGVTDWDAIAKAWQANFGGAYGQAYAAYGGTRESPWGAYASSVAQGSKATIDAYSALRSQNAEAMKAITAGSRSAAGYLAKPFPVVVDARSPAFQLRLPSQQAATAKSGGLPTWTYAAAVGVAALAWVWWRKRKARAGGA